MIISVTQKNIDEGYRGSCTLDPIAHAMRAAKLIKPRVSPTSISWIDNHGYKKEVETPDGVLYFLKRFDNQEYVSPFEFFLEE